MMAMNDNIADLLDIERQRAAREANPETPERRKRRLAMNKWHRNLSSVWHCAHLMTDDELLWLSTITEASNAKKTRKGGRSRRPTTGDDAIRLDALESELWQRRHKHESLQDRDDRREVAARLRRLGLPVPEYFRWAEAYAEVAAAAGQIDETH
jgi:hypothetical protein